MWLLPRKIKTTRPSNKLDYGEIGPFKILAKIGTNAYKLALPPSMAIHNTLHITLLEPYQENPFPSQIKEAPPRIQIEGEDEYELDESIDWRLHYNNLQYWAKWKAYSPNTIKSGTLQKTSTMQNTQSNESTSATQESPEWIHVTITRSSSAPHPVVQQRRLHTPESDAQRIARNATPTSPEYSG